MLSSSSGGRVVRWSPFCCFLPNFVSFATNVIQSKRFPEEKEVVQKWDKDLSIFILQCWLFAYLCGYSGFHINVKKCVAVRRICMGMDVWLGVYSCTVAALQRVVRCYKVFICLLVLPC